MQHMLPAIRRVSGDHFIFQQDSAPAHCTRNCYDTATTHHSRFHSTRHGGHRTHQTSVRWIVPSGMSFSNVCMRPEFMTSMSCDSVYCMCGAAWSSCWLMTQLTNGERVCMLVFVPVADIFNILCDYQFVSLYLINFMFHTMLDAAGNILRVHYKSMKCDVSFPLGSVSTLFR